MKRRNFLRSAGMLSLPALIGAPGLAAAPNRLLSALMAASTTDNILVLIQLVGGNDGLNTLVPLDQYETLTDLRSNIILPQSSLLGLNTTNALHPSMTAMQNLYLDGHLGIVQSVGYPNQNRSHFRSTDIWTSASESTVEEPTGWLGRMLENDHPSFPEGYPNSGNPHPLAMIMGNVVSATCQGSAANFSLAVRDPFNFTYIAPGGDTPIPSGAYGDELAFVRQTIAQSNEYGSIVTDAANAGNSNTGLYSGSNLSNQLSDIVSLISGGLETRVYVATLGGFDTHAFQTSNTDATQGNHANLLADLSESIAAFQADLVEKGLADRVLGMTFSEFGRQIRSNESTGTDHGTAAPLFLFGNCVQGSILGNSPELDPATPSGEGVPMQYDFRDIYASVMIDWFGLSDTTVRNLLYADYTYLPIVNGCSALPVEWLSFAATAERSQVKLEWQTASESTNQGFEVERSEDGRDFHYVGFVAGAGDSRQVNSYEFIDRDVVRGPLYYYRLRQIDSDGSESYSTIRTARLIGSAIGQWQVGLPTPNPVRSDSRIQIFAPSDTNATYEIIDASGRRISSGLINLIGGRDNVVELREVGNLPAGIYVWRMRAGNQDFSHKLVRN